MDIKTFLEKDIIVFLENIEKYGTKEKQAVEDDMSSLFTSSVKSEEKPKETTPTSPTQVNVTISRDQLEPAPKPQVIIQKEIIREVVHKPASNLKPETPKKAIIPDISIEPEPKIVTPPVIEEKPTPVNVSSITESKLVPEVKPKVVPEPIPKETPVLESEPKIVTPPVIEKEIPEPVVNPDHVIEEETKPSKLPPTPEIISKPEPISKPESNMPKPIVKVAPSLPELETPVNQIDPYSQGEIESQLTELRNYMSNQDIDNALKLYNHLRQLGINIKMDSIVEKELFSLLQETARFLTEHKPKLAYEKTQSLIKPNEKLPEIKTSLEGLKLSHFIKSYMKEYLEGLNAIKIKDKLNALKILVPLSKEHPKNRAIKLRIKEALAL